MSTTFTCPNCGAEFGAPQADDRDPRWDAYDDECCRHERGDCIEEDR